MCVSIFIRSGRSAFHISSDMIGFFVYLYFGAGGRSPHLIYNTTKT